MDELETLKMNILNAIQVGMDYADAIILSGASEEQIKLLEDDALFKQDCKVAVKKLEQSLLETLMDTITIQASKGKDHGVTWLLSKINPQRYTGEDDPSASVGSIVINTQHVDISDPNNATDVDGL